MSPTRHRSRSRSFSQVRAFTQSQKRKVLLWRVAASGVTMTANSHFAQDLIGADPTEYSGTTLMGIRGWLETNTNGATTGPNQYFYGFGVEDRVAAAAINISPISGNNEADLAGFYSGLDAWVGGGVISFSAQGVIRIDVRGRRRLHGGGDSVFLYGANDSANLVSCNYVLTLALMLP